MNSRLSYAFTLLILPALAACQIGPGTSLRSHEQLTFMDLWKVYEHCRSTDDPERMMLDAVALHHAVHGRDAQIVPPVLSPIRKLIDPIPIRLSVDPRAMAVDCTLRAADAVVAKGWTDLAIQMYTAMIPAYQAPEFSYYLREARAGLAAALEQEGPRSSRLRVE